MNIFVVDSCPSTSARMLCNRHCVKMVLESCQMLSTVHHLSETSTSVISLYKKCFVNHPCTIWARNSTSNYMWLAEHALELSYEYERRYNKSHKCKQMCEWFVKNIPVNVPNGPLTPFSQAMPDKYKCDDAVIAYQNYYIGEKAKFAKWNNSIIPEWFKTGMNNVCLSVL